MTQNEAGPGGDRGPRRDVSPERQGAFYIGGAMMVVGFLSFFSVFVTGAMNFGDFTDFESRTRGEAMRAVIGMGLIVVGAFVRNVGRAGAAGSGLVLDPRQARKDLEPFSRQNGGMLKDALDEAGVDLGKALGGAGGKPVVMIRCRACSKLNEEDSKFCQECGAAI
jgi:cytochrome c biogenesis protein CcdA